MNDRELMEKAARAAGYEIWTDCNGSVYTGDPEMPWNPLKNDGDAFRLMCDLNIMVRFQNKDSAVVEFDIWADGEDGFFYCDASREINVNDIPSGKKSEHLRRAITRAAAALAENA